MKRFTAMAVIATLLFACPLVGNKAYASSGVSSTSVKKNAVSGSSLNIAWKKVSSASGYQIQYANNRLFLNYRTVTVTKGSATHKTINKGSMTLCYSRVRAYKSNNGKRTYSNWALSRNCSISKEATINRMTKSGKTFELRAAAKQTIGKYDTLQGGCTYGSTGWFILYNRKVSKCKLVKMNMKTMKVTKVSQILSVSHGSDVAYNPDTKQLVVVHGPSNYKRVSVVDPKTLKIKRNLSITLSSSTSGSSAKRARKFKGVTAMAYNTKHNVYVARLKSQSNIVLYDKNFKPIRYIKLSKYDKQLYQGMDSYDDYILISQSPNKNGRYNIISVYNWNGKYLSKIRLSRSYELETIFHRNGKLYAGYYRSYYKTYYLDKFRIKVVNGKKNKVKTWLKYTKFMRDNYFYKVTNL